MLLAQAQVKIPGLPSLAESTGVLFALLPGLLTYLIVVYLSNRERKHEPTSAVLHGLGYTICVHALWTVVSWLAGLLKPVPQDVNVQLVGLCLVAVLFGVTISWLNNSGRFHAWLRKLGLTHEASWPTIWETAFREFRRAKGEYLVLNLKNGDRVMGLLAGFSSAPKEGHVVLSNYVFLQVEGQGTHELQTEIGSYLVSADDVSSIQFITS